MKARLRARGEAQAGLTWVEGLVIGSILLLLAAVSYPRARGHRIAEGEAAAVRALDRVARSRGSELAPGTPAPGVRRTPGLERAREVGEGTLEADGYLFRILPPFSSPETTTSPMGGFAVVAWPVEYGRTGNAVFWLDEAGVCLETRNARRRYSGLANPPPVAVEPPDPARAGRKRPGIDQEEWRPLELPVQK